MPGLADHGVGLRAGIGEQLVGLGLRGTGQPVGGVLREAEHLGGLDMGGVARSPVPRRRVVHRLRGRRRSGFGLRLGLVERDRLGGLRYATTACPGGPQVLIQLGDPLTQVRVLLDEPSQLVLNQVEECIDFVLVVAALADGWLAERDIVDVGWCERHCLPP